MRRECRCSFPQSTPNSGDNCRVLVGKSPTDAVEERSLHHSRASFTAIGNENIGHLLRVILSAEVVCSLEIDSAIAHINLFRDVTRISSWPKERFHLTSPKLIIDDDIDLKSNGIDISLIKMSEPAWEVRKAVDFIFPLISHIRSSTERDLGLLRANRLFKRCIGVISHPASSRVD